jgi:putative IMPACT (imprinted ancient) family translation regulator
MCLKTAQLVEMKPSLEGCFHLNFSDLALVKARLAGQPDIQILDEVFDAIGAEIRVRVPEVDVETIARMISDLASGRSLLSFD